MSWTKWQRVEGEGLDFAEIIDAKRTHDDTGGGVAGVSINRPERFNAVTNVTVDEMFRAFYDANHDPAVGVIVLAGVGKHFGTGGDVDWERWGLREAFYFRYPQNRIIRQSRKPIIAAVQGYCIGGSNHLAYCCDFTLAADNAVFAQAGPKVPSPADGYFVPHLVRVVRATAARALWALCRRYPAKDPRATRPGAPRPTRIWRVTTLQPATGPSVFLWPGPLLAAPLADARCYTGASLAVTR